MSISEINFNEIASGKASKKQRTIAPGAMGFLFIVLMLTLKTPDYREFSLGMAPHRGLEARNDASLWMQAGDRIVRHGGQFYNFEGLRRFTEKFDPDWRPSYLAGSGALPSLVPLADAAKLISACATNTVFKGR